MDAIVAPAREADDRSLVLDRHLAAPRAALWRCWTEPAMLTRWFTPAPWLSSERPFFFAEMSFEDEGAGTLYRAVARHWTAEARAEHEAMGFRVGWNAAADQLEALAKTL